LRNNLLRRLALLLTVLIFSSSNAINHLETVDTAVLSMSRLHNELVVRGSISSEANERILQRAAVDHFANDQRTLELTQQQSLPPRWALISEITLTSLAPLSVFDATIRSDEIRINGIADSGEQVTQLLIQIERVLPADMRFKHNIQVIHQDQSFDRLCQKRFDAATHDRGIRFDNSGKIVTTESYPLLDTLVEISFDCPRAHFTVTGYSDDRGEPPVNLALSLERAQSAIAYMRDKGVPADKLKAIGLGSANQAATNTTATGRRLNRRLEFSMKIGNFDGNR
jgi:OOP family OmpA-OmpF porin